MWEFNTILNDVTPFPVVVEPPVRAALSLAPCSTRFYLNSKSQRSQNLNPKNSNVNFQSQTPSLKSKSQRSQNLNPKNSNVKSQSQPPSRKSKSQRFQNLNPKNSNVKLPIPKSRLENPNLNDLKNLNPNNSNVKPQSKILPLKTQTSTISKSQS